MAKQPRRSTRLGDDAIADPEAMSIVPVEHVQSKILLIRGQKVILDADLAGLYGVATSRLNEQVKRNIRRFPPDFAFRLTQDELAHLKSHSAISSSTWGGRRKLPYAFTEHRVRRSTLHVSRRMWPQAARPSASAEPGSSSDPDATTKSKPPKPPK